jgi:hypothetical protein
MFKYPDGVEIHKGDQVLVACQIRAKVHEILHPLSKESNDFDCAQTGGFVLRYKSGELVVYTEDDPDITLVAREECSAPSKFPSA